MRRHLMITILLAGGAEASLPSVVSAQACDANVPHLTGEWVTLPYQMPINPISATLLHTGQVLIVAGSENDARNNSEGSESYRAAVWDPTGTTESSINVQNVSYDVFCSGTAALPDGRALVVGGTSDYTFTGDNRASIFDPATGAFAQSQSMVDGRWYATATTLADGRIMAFSGLTLTGGTTRTVEIYDLANAGAGWTPPRSAPFTPPLYPRLAVLPNGKVFYTGQGFGSPNANSWIFDPIAVTWTVSAPTTLDRGNGSFAILPLLPPGYTPRIMNFGGGGNTGTNTTEIIDLSAASPSWAPGPNMSTGRKQMNAVILPNGRILAEGGSVTNESPDMAGKRADLYDPVTNTFSPAGTASYSRLYHSAALLLPDATVMSMGSNPGPRGRYVPAIEIYTPAYLFDANDQLITTNRPRITGVGPSGVVGYNAPFWVSYTSSSAISTAVLVRPGSSTHAYDMEQRIIGLCGPSPQPACNASGGTLDLTSPPNANIAPPGYYMLFLLDSEGVPSVAQFIQLSRYATSPPDGAIDSPGSDVTILAGGSVFFGTTTSAPKYSWVFPGGSPAYSTSQTPGNVVFGAPGTYVTSLTVIDANGNSDPSPPTRTITVTPIAPDFTIAVSPPAQVVTPGGSTTFTVTVTPLNGFSDAVSLSVESESGFPAGVTSGGFSPPAIAGSGSSTLTMNSTASAVPYATSLTITGAAGPLTHTASTTLLVNLDPPANLVATAGSGQTSLSWLPSVGANGYQVKRSTVSGGPYVAVACPTTTSYVDSGLTAGTTYDYVVAASFTGGRNGGGASPDSNEASATQAPLPPMGLTATPGDAQVVLGWSASTGATSYKVKRATASGGPYTVVASPSSTSYTDTGVTNGTTYYYVVSAVNAGGESSNSTEASATPQAQAPLPPTGLTATPGDGQVVLGWTASTGATSYKVKRATVSGGPYTVVASPSSTSYTDTAVTNGTMYYYVVSAVNAGGESSNSTEASATPQATIPAPPSGLTANATKPGRINLRWIQSATAGVTTNNIYRRTSTGSYPSTPTVTINAATSFLDTGLTKRTTYCYVVTAKSAGGESARSNEACATAK